MKLTATKDEGGAVSNTLPSEKIGQRLKKLQNQVHISELSPQCFANDFVSTLPGDPLDTNTPRDVPGACFSLTDPTPVCSPILLAWSEELGGSLGLRKPDYGQSESIEVIAGNRVLTGMRPYSTRYGGYQFGQWAGQLGDGRAITLTELLTSDGGHFELQLKGAGRTPYSRQGDGRATLRSSVREFIASEAMHALGVPTTRVLSVVKTGKYVTRNPIPDGNALYEPGGVICRIAPSFLRFGNFEIHSARGEIETLERLANYLLTKHFADFLPLSPENLGRCFIEICRRTAHLVVEWMRVGFVHGVMNTDNMSILGLTLDYGPFGWLDAYDPAWTPNTMDGQSLRYCFGRQSKSAHWNLERLANALLPVVRDPSLLQYGLVTYSDEYNSAWGRMMANKLGLRCLDQKTDQALLIDLFNMFEENETDMTIFFRCLSKLQPGQAYPTDNEKLFESIRPSFYSEESITHKQYNAWVEWLNRLLRRAIIDGISPEVRQRKMESVNPKFVPRSYLLQMAVDGIENGDPFPFERLMKALEKPYDNQPEHEELAVRKPEWARDRDRCSVLSCSS